jgi:hypothetical protein
MTKTNTKAKAKDIKPARKIRFKLVIDAQPMLVDYVAYWMGGADPYGHISSSAVRMSRSGAFRSALPATAAISRRWKPSRRQPARRNTRGRPP